MRPAGASVAGVDAQTETEGVASLVAQLVEEPLLHASLGSKELFHTNLLAWMVRRYPDRMREVFGPWLADSASTTEQVRTEYEHLDLVVEFAGHQALVIENKTFALPDEQQLERYAKKAVRAVAGEPTLVLLSLIDPGWEGGTHTVAGRTWRWMSYRELGDRLAAAFADCSGFDQEIVLHEAHLVRLLDRTMAAAGVVDPGESLRMSPELHALLAPARIADAVRRARGHQVMRLIKARLRADGVREPAWEYEVGFAHGDLCWRRSGRGRRGCSSAGSSRPTSGGWRWSCGPRR